MGSGLEASCSCGFSVPEFAVGGGMSDFTTTCWAPAYCATCRTLLVANYIAKRPACPTCKSKVVFYDEPSLRAPGDTADHRHSDARIVFSWLAKSREFRMSAAPYLCPACGEFNLEFRSTGLLWD